MSIERRFSGFSQEHYLSRLRNAFHGYSDFSDFILGAIEDADATLAHQLIVKGIRELANSVNSSRKRPSPRWYQHPIGWAFDPIYLDTSSVLVAIQTALKKALENSDSALIGAELLELEKCFSRLTKAAAEYDSSLKELNRLQNLLTKQTLNYYADEIDKEPDSSVIGSVRELFDLWVVSAETLNVRALASSSYVKAYTDLISAGCRLKAELDTIQRIAVNLITEGVFRELREKIELLKGSAFER